ncbi:MAG: hypothetical protein IRY89_15880 [Pseudolabrys sp.]|nr:hypothetical protein [Pseudolabrys sp.]
MALASELVEVLADATGIERTTLARYARFAREAGLLSQSGRGKSAARMRPRDAVNLLVCTLANGIAQEAPKQIRTVNDMAVYSRDADSLDDRHLSKDQQNRLREILPILFDRDHSLTEMLLALVESAIADWQQFEDHFGHSFITFDCDDYAALIHFNIRPTGEGRPFGDELDFLFSYNHPRIGRRSQNYRRSTHLTFTVIARVGQLMSAT